jgi:hypothetical protein
MCGTKFHSWILTILQLQFQERAKLFIWKISFKTKEIVMRRLTRIKDNENFGLKLNNLKSISKEKLFI